MIPHQIQKWRDCLDYECKRMGHDIHFPDRPSEAQFDLEGIYFRMTTKEETVRLHVYQAVKSIWGRPMMALTTGELMKIFQGAA